MRARLLVPALLTALVVPLLGSSAQAVDARVADTAAGAAEGSTDAGMPPELAAVQAIFSGKQVAASDGFARRAQADASGPREATMALRDLAVAMPSYGRADRLAAQRILARPVVGAPGPDWEQKYQVPAEDVRNRCFAHVCVHWVETTDDAIDLTDANADGLPDYVGLVGRTLEHVWSVQIDKLGYRPPRDDLGTAAPTTANPNSKLDVFLTELEDEDLFGYCATEVDPAALRTYAAAYCAMDNDFVYAKWPSANPLNELRATAAHEFFHAVQFGYDYAEDIWFMEGSAAWMEEVVYDSINSNRRWLAWSPVRRPWLPLDYADDQFVPYGSWTFLQYLQERVARTPNVIRLAWRHADASPQREWSDGATIGSLNNALKAYGSTFSQAFAGYVTGNRTKSTTYSEGAAWPSPVTAETLTLTASRPGTGSWWVQTRHLAAQTVRYQAGKSLTGKRKLRINVDMPSRATMPFVRVLVFERTGRVRTYSVKLDTDGRGKFVAPFTRRTVKYVELVLGNGSTRMKCWQDTYFSCQGTPLDDNRRGYFSAKAIKG